MCVWRADYTWTFTTLYRSFWIDFFTQRLLFTHLLFGSLWCITYLWVSFVEIPHHPTLLVNIKGGTLEIGGEEISCQVVLKYPEGLWWFRVDSCRQARFFSRGEQKYFHFYHAHNKYEQLFLNARWSKSRRFNTRVFLNTRVILFTREKNRFNRRPPMATKSRAIINMRGIKTCA